MATFLGSKKNFGIALLILLLCPVFGLIVSYSRAVRLSRLAKTVAASRPDDFSVKDLAGLLDVMMWEYRFHCAPHDNLLGRLELREKGHPTKLLCSFEAPSAAGAGKTQGVLRLLIHPIEDLSGRIDNRLTRADKIKWVVALPGMNTGGPLDNPFKNATFYEFDNQIGQPPIDVVGAHCIIRAEKVKSPSQYGKSGAERREISLFIVLKTKPSNKAGL